MLLITVSTTNHREWIIKRQKTTTKRMLTIIIVYAICALDAQDIQGMTIFVCSTVALFYNSINIWLYNPANIQ